MALESATYISGLVATNPASSDGLSQADDHLKLIKATLLATFPNVTGAVTPTHTELNYVDGVTSAIQTQMDLKAPKANPTFTGTVVLPSDTSVGDVSATELGYVNGVTSAIQTQMDLKAPLASPALTGNPTAPTQSPGDDSTKIATTAYVDDAVAAVGGGGGVEFVSSSVASASAYIEFTGFASGYDYEVRYDGAYGSIGNGLAARLLNSGSPDTGANYDYVTLYADTDDAAAGVSKNEGTTDIALGVAGAGFGSSATGRQSGRVYLHNPAATTNARILDLSMVEYSGTQYTTLKGHAMYRSTTAVDGIRFYLRTAGTITAGTFNLYRIARS